jgi:sulfate permease, SulP family
MREAPERNGVLSGLRQDFALGALGATLATGLVLALVNTLLSIALMSLIFRDGLQELLPLGIGLGLVGSAAIGLVLAVGSSFRGMFAGIQDASAAIIGLSAVSIVGALGSGNALDTVIATIAVASLATGAVFLAMGYLGLGEIARFVPFPVIGGLLAGTGYLILMGSLGTLGVTDLSDLGVAESVGSFWPGLLLAFLFFVAARRGWGSRAYLVFLVVAVIGFHLISGIMGLGRGDALERGWLLGPFPEGSLWPGTIFTHLAGADWGLIAGEVAGLVTILLIAPITLLLYISGLETATRTDVDMNRELGATGWANLAAGLVGSPPGYMYLADTVITSRLVGMRRGPAIVAPLVMVVVVVFAGSVLEMLPQFVIGGMLLFVGVEFLYDWLWASRRRMTKTDYTLMWVILVVIATVGFLEGVAVGLVAAIALFVIRYSRIDVVKHALSGSDYQSNIERAPVDTDYLRETGEATQILELQGFVFFGTASRILGRIRDHAEDRNLRFVVCDFRLVTGVDSSAVAIFERIVLLARDRGIVLVLTGLKSAQQSQFHDLLAFYGDAIVEQPDLDHGMAWCEDRLLADKGIGDEGGSSLPEELEDALTPYLDERVIGGGELFMRQGDPTQGIFLITSGRATVLLEGADGPPVRLRTLLSGTVLGEISLYRDEPCTATVVADTECGVLHLTPERFDELCRVDPAVAAELHRFVARTLAGRVGHANRSIRALHG